MSKWLFLALGGVVGTFARYGVVQTVARVTGAPLPWGTFAVNVAGCLAAGILTTASAGRFLGNERERMLLLAGFCGAFTTFSAYMFDAHGMLKTGHPLKMACYVTGSVLAGFLAFALGARLGGRF